MRHAHELTHLERSDATGLTNKADDGIRFRCGCHWISLSGLVQMERETPLEGDLAVELGKLSVGQSVNTRGVDLQIQCTRMPVGSFFSHLT